MNLIWIGIILFILPSLLTERRAAWIKIPQEALLFVFRPLLRRRKMTGMPSQPTIFYSNHIYICLAVIETCILLLLSIPWRLFVISEINKNCYAFLYRNKIEPLCGSCANAYFSLSCLGLECERSKVFWLFFILDHTSSHSQVPISINHEYCTGSSAQNTGARPLEVGVSPSQLCASATHSALPDIPNDLLLWILHIYISIFLGVLRWLLLLLLPMLRVMLDGYAQHARLI